MKETHNRRKSGNVSKYSQNNCPEIAPLILNHLDTLLKNLDKYFSSISIDQYDWVRNPLRNLNHLKDNLHCNKKKNLPVFQVIEH